MGDIYLFTFGGAWLLGYALVLINAEFLDGRPGGVDWVVLIGGCLWPVWFVVFVLWSVYGGLLSFTSWLSGGRS